MYLIEHLNRSEPSAVSEAFNEAFSDYLVPLSMTVDALDEKCRSENIDFDNSVGVYINQRLVGFILTGIGNENGEVFAYNAGTGVLPGYRGKGLTLKMYAFLISLLLKKKVAVHRLEVICENIHALRVYVSIGFIVRRELQCYRGTVSVKSRYNNILFKSMGCLSSAMGSFYDSQPSFQNSDAVMDRNKANTVIIAAIYVDKVIGFIRYNKNTGRVHQFGVDRQYRRRGIGSQLFEYVQLRFGGGLLSIINVQADDKGTNNFLAAIGFDKTVKQYEMEYKV